MCALQIDARVKQKTGVPSEFAGYTLLEGEVALVRSSPTGPVIQFKVGPGNFDSLDWSLQNPGAAQKADTSTVFPSGVPGLYIPTESGTYNGVTVDTSVGYVQLVWDGTALTKVEFPIDLAGYATSLYAIESKSNWFVPQSFQYSDMELSAINGIEYFWSTNEHLIIAVFGKGHATAQNTIRVQDSIIGITSRQELLQNNIDTGLHYYQFYLTGGDLAVIVVNWDLVPENSGFLINTSSAKVVATTEKSDLFFNNVVIDDVPSSTISNIGNFIRFDGREMVAKSYNATARIVRDSINPGDSVELSCTYHLDQSTTNGVMMGFNRASSQKRVLFGYEPSYNGVCFYIEGKSAFDVVMSNKELPFAGPVQLSIKIENNEISGTCNGRTFSAHDFTDMDFTDFDLAQYQVKAVDSAFRIMDVNVNESVPTDIFNKLGSQVAIYKTGDGVGVSGYNDWCFVRTPKNYDKNRVKPYPFVICNHGNGWTMNGTESRANYTDKTMFGVDDQNDGAYLNPSAPYYKQYSNETIERLLEAGYVVCGCQNYADVLYGNDPGRNALQDFHFHMINNWNVENKCYMIGASNGAMMSLNGAYLLGVERVKAMILQYPLTCLFRHYKGYAPHQSGMRSAYGISTSSPTDQQLHEAFNDHDPEYANSVEISGVRYKTKLLPPMKLWWSSTDTVTAPENNSIPLIELINRSNGKVESVQIDISGGTMGHGDWRHFDPVDTIEFFNTYR